MTAIRQPAWETEQLYQRLHGLPTGSTVSYRELSDLIHRNVQRDGRSYLQTAFNRLQSQDGVLFQIARNEGVRRVESGEAVVTEQPVLRNKLRNTTRRAKNRLLAAERDRESFGPEAKTAATQQHAFIGVLEVVMSRKTVHTIEKAVEQNPENPETVLKGTLKLWATRRPKKEEPPPASTLM